MEDDEDGSVGHFCKVEKTAASAILKSNDVTEDVGQLGRAEKTTVTNGDDVPEDGSKQTRRLPQLEAER